MENLSNVAAMISDQREFLYEEQEEEREAMKNMDYYD